LKYTHEETETQNGQKPVQVQGPINGRGQDLNAGFNDWFQIYDLSFIIVGVRLSPFNAKKLMQLSNAHDLSLFFKRAQKELDEMEYTEILCKLKCYHVIGKKT
jgi:hypothetical protein